MALTPGTRLGPYEVSSSIGAGGMGEVYCARDTRLGRDVAIKVSAEQFGERFEREARAIAALNHVNICTLHDVGPNYLVMELVPGSTLADKIALGSGPGAGLSMEEALAIATQIAAALETAHEKGILHRDLKPANVKVTPAGVVKVLDFGLAKIRETDPAIAGLSNSPTLLTAASLPGTILGTAAYMAPEQAKGQPADRSSDVWAFGCVLYEMLTGARAFEGGSVSEILAEVLKSEPDWARLPADTPGSIRRLLGRCLQKDRKRRLHDMADVAIEILDAKQETPAALPAAPPPSRRTERLAWASVLALVTLGAVALGISALRPVPPAPEMRVEITTPPTTDPVSLAISPDGRQIVFVALVEGRSRLWLRPLGMAPGAPLPGTDDASLPFWSPNSQSVAFFAEGLLKRVDVAGGSAQIVAKAARGYPGAWTKDGTILFSPSGIGPIVRVSAAGGDPVAVTELANRQTGHRFAQLLADGRHFLYFALGDADVRGIYVGRLDGRDGSEGRRVLVADGAAMVAASGHVLFVRQGTLLAQPFDPRRLTLSGEPFSIAEQVTFDNFLNFPALSTSAAGPVIYRTGSAGARRQLVWFDRSGKEIARVGDPDGASPFNPSLSPDGRRVALNRSVAGNTDIWMIDTARGVASRVTSNVAMENFPIWSPDGQRIVFSSNRKGTYDLYRKTTAGAGDEEVLLQSPDIKTAHDWSSDGRFVLYRTNTPKGGDDLWALPLEGDRKPPIPVAQTAFDESHGRFSPDGRWIAYESNESDRFEVYLQPFPGPGSRSRVSTAGGAQVQWRRDGKELFYIAADGRLMAVPIRFGADSQTVEVAAPAPLFMTRVGGFRQGINGQQYVVDADGQRFLMNTITEEPASPITVILNWTPKR